MRAVGEAEHLRVSMTDDVVVIEPVDVPDRHSVEALDRLLSEVEAPAVIDLRHCTPVAAKLLSWLDPRCWGRAPGSVSIVTGRGDRATRELAARRGFAVFGQPADAIQARLLADTGYGTGWA